MFAHVCLGSILLFVCEESITKSDTLSIRQPGRSVWSAWTKRGKDDEKFRRSVDLRHENKAPVVTDERRKRGKKPRRRISWLGRKWAHKKNRCAHVCRVTRPFFFSDIWDQYNDYSDIFDLRRRWVGEVTVVTFFVFEIFWSQIRNVNILYTYTGGQNYRFYHKMYQAKVYIIGVFGSVNLLSRFTTLQYFKSDNLWRPLTLLLREVDTCVR